MFKYEITVINLILKLLWANQYYTNYHAIKDRQIKLLAYELNGTRHYFHSRICIMPTTHVIASTAWHVVIGGKSSDRYYARVRVKTWTHHTTATLRRSMLRCHVLVWCRVHMWYRVHIWFRVHLRYLVYLWCPVHNMRCRVHIQFRVRVGMRYLILEVMFMCDVVIVCDVVYQYAISYPYVMSYLYTISFPYTMSCSLCNWY